MIVVEFRRTSGEASSVTIFGTPIGGGPATTVGSEKWSKDNGTQSWWWMHQNTVLLIVFGIFLALCVTAIMVRVITFAQQLVGSPYTLPHPFVVGEEER